MAPDRQRTASTNKTVMTYIAPRTEALARAMCISLNAGPDDPEYLFAPAIIDRPAMEITKHWHFYVWEAQKWIYEHSGGELPEREGEGRG